MPYTIEEHQHRFAAWAAATAASSRKDFRFRVEFGVCLLEQSGFDENFSCNDLGNPQEIDSLHRTWCRNILFCAEQGLNTGLSYGIVAKLVNCYLKARFVCSGLCHDERVKVLHPPIDRILLQELNEQNEEFLCPDVLNQLRQVGEVDRLVEAFPSWSYFNEDQYQIVINRIRDCFHDDVQDGFWKIEKYWKGYQG